MPFQKSGDRSYESKKFGTTPSSTNKKQLKNKAVPKGSQASDAAESAATPKSEKESLSDLEQQAKEASTERD